MARSKSSSSGLRLAFYPEHILWELELWSRLRDHIKQWLFVVNKARAACRGPSCSLSLSFSSRLLPGSSLPTIILDCQTNVRQCTTSLSVPFVFVHKDHEPGSITDKIKFVGNSKARWKAQLKVCLERMVKTKSPEQLFRWFWLWLPGMKHNVLMLVYWWIYSLLQLLCPEDKKRV